MASSLLQLSKLISSSAGNIAKHCDDSGITIPGPQDNIISRPVDMNLLSGPLLSDVTKIVDAAQQLIELLTPADAMLLRLAQGTCTSAALRVALEAHIAEMLREAPNGMLSAKKLAAHSQIDAHKLTRVLRVLAAVNVFREVESGVFTNTRLSSALDTGKSVQALTGSTVQTMHNGTHGTLAILHTYIDEASKANAYLTETLLAPPVNDGLADTAFKRAFPDYDSWQSSPYYTKMACVYPGIEATIWNNEPCFDFNDLPEGATIVGVGACARLICGLAEKNPHLRFMVQDSAEMCEEWPKILDKPAADLRAGFVAHNMLEAQPVKDASVFIIGLSQYLTLKEDLVLALSHLHAAATPQTRLLILLGITNSEAADLPQEKVEFPVEPAGVHPVFSTIWDQVDLYVMSLANGVRYRFPDLDNLLRGVGWSTTKISVMPTGHSILVAERVEA